MFFDPPGSHTAEDRHQTPRGRCLDSRKEKLILDLVAPAAGESVLGVGCGNGDDLLLFGRKKCLLTGMDPSQAALDAARSRLGESCELVLGDAADIPFSDNQFDVVTLTGGLQRLANPRKVLAEAVRVSRNRVFVGFLNRHSPAGTGKAARKLFGFPEVSDVRFFSVGEMRTLIGQAMPGARIQWGSVMCLPGPAYDLAPELEDLLPIRKNPLGAYVGMVFAVHCTYRTVQHPVMDSFQLKAKARAAAPEAVRDMLRGGGR
ncbi:MAG: methyltransferase domain-containing protein [Smithellaceae bacterium]|jgi:SAM-dependent methyltransferase|nr:methyltransferase domain-containing protein [Smithellaceae bacterium]MDD3258291.1 methyltransferase domain-containing protein [Smithellaceae bacterium]MDD3848397.1 methyltransferase domain-containing protein [Smithellaceae bacterium]HOG13171.1 methyltransferase domain-containing protein [Smithellaceae bacterium]